MEEIIEAMASHYDEAERIASYVVKAMAHNILEEHKGELIRFEMGMGFYSFVDKEGRIIDTFDSIVSEQMEESFKELNDFIGQWDKVLKITGEQMVIENE